MTVTAEATAAATTLLTDTLTAKEPMLVRALIAPAGPASTFIRDVTLKVSFSLARRSA